MKSFLNYLFVAFMAFTLVAIGATAGLQAALLTLFVYGVVLVPWRSQPAGQLCVTTFNDKLYANGILQQVVDMLTPISAFSTDFSGSLGRPGDTLVVPLYGAITSTTFTQATDVMEQTGGTVSAVTLTINARKIVPVDLTTQQLIDSSASNNMDAFQYQMAESLASMVVTDVLSTFTVSNYGAPTTTASANFKLDAITAIRVALNAKLCPKGNRTLIIDDAVEAGIFSDTNIVLALNRGGNQTINEGDIGRLLGFNIITTTNLGMASISRIGIACGKGAAAVAFRSLGDVYPEEDYAAREVVTHSGTGISLLYTRHWSRPQAKWFLNLQALYGYVKAVTLQGHIVCTATT